MRPTKIISTAAIAYLGNLVLSHLFLPEIHLNLNEKQKKACEQAFQMVTAEGAVGAISLPDGISKHEILHYLVNQEDLLLHGSNLLDIELLEPKERSDYKGDLITAIFATQDAVWPMFFAVLDQSKFQGSIRNSCFVVTDHKGRSSRYYFFSIDKEMHQQHPWTDGMVYVLPRAPFFKTSLGVLRFDEWACNSAVQPLSKLPISPKDFPYLSKVTHHDKKESTYLTWLHYRNRLKA